MADLPLLCAGQDCSRRRDCMRYKLRGAVARYASFDIELRIFKGPCPAFEQYRPQQRGSQKVTLHRTQYRT